MCKKGGFRCASHLSAKIKSLEAVEEKSVDEEAQLREMKYAYYGTRTGQKELDKSIEKAEDNGKDDTAERLKKTKMIASMLREEEAKQHQEKAGAEESDNRAKEAQKSMKDDDDVASVLPPDFDMDKAEPTGFDEQYEKTREEHQSKGMEFQRFYASEVRRKYDKEVAVRDPQTGLRKREWEKTDNEVVQDLKNDNTEEGRELRKKYSAHVKDINKHKKALDKMNDKYVERGKWNRAFLAASGGDGHVHNSAQCSTCNKGKNATQFKWMTSYSGQNEDSIVGDAGYRACTVCYPSAPVGDAKSLPTKMFSDDEIQKDKDRKERAEQKSEKAKQAISKAPTASGEPLTVGMDRFKTETTATTGYTDRVMSYYVNKAEKDPEYKGNQQYVEQQRQESLKIVKSLAEKRDISIKEMQEELKPKLMTKIKKHNRDRTKTTHIELINNIEHRDGPELEYFADDYGLSEEKYNTSPLDWKD